METTAEQAKRKWGRKMYLISPSAYENYKRLEEKKPYYRNENAADYKNQLNDERIVSNQINKKLEIEKEKKAVSDLLKPVISDAIISTEALSDKQKIRQLLLMLDGQSNIQISDQDIIINGKKIPLEKLIKDLLTEDTSDFSYDINTVLQAFLEAEINPDLIKNVQIKKQLIDLQKEEALKKQEASKQAGNEDQSIENPPFFNIPSFTSTRQSSPQPSPEKKPLIEEVRLPTPKPIKHLQLPSPKPHVERSPSTRPDDNDVQFQAQPFRAEATPPPLVGPVQHSPRPSVRPRDRDPPPQPTERTPISAKKLKQLQQQQQQQQQLEDEFPTAPSQKIKRTPPVKPKASLSDSAKRKSQRDVEKPKKYGKGGFQWETF